MSSKIKSKLSYKTTSKGIAKTAIVAALYIALTFATFSISYGGVQFRISEALTILPVFMPSAIPGLAIGCFFGNMLSAYGLIDMVVGSLTTLAAGVFTYLFRKNYAVAGIFPVIFNALIIPLVIKYGGAPESYKFFFISLLISQTVVVYAIGVPFAYYIKKKQPKLIELMQN